MTRTVDFRYIVMRNGADFSQLQTARDATPWIYMDEGSEIKMSFSGDFIPNDEVNWLTDQLRPEISIDGVWSPLGIFLPATVTPSEISGVETVHVEAYDRCWLVRDQFTEAIASFPAGDRYTDIVGQLLAECGIVQMLVAPSNATLSERREDWNIGTSALEIVNQLLGEINYNPLWFNAQGAAIAEPASVPTAENVEHMLDASNVHSLMLPQISRTTDVYQAPNVFVCVVSNADKAGPMVATAENTNPQSPLSIQRRGRRIVSIKYVDNVADQSELQEYANRLRNQSLYTGEVITVKTGLLPGFGVDDVVALNYGDLSAICIERGFSMELKVGGTMTHRLERMVIALE